MTVKRLLVLLDVYPGTGPEAWLSPAVPADDLVLLTGHGFQRVESGASFDWLELGAAVEALADRALELVAGADDGAELYIGGQAPLSLFVHLGFRLSKFVGKQTFLARGPAGGAVEQFDLTLPAEGDDRIFAEAALPQTAASAFGTGLLALYVDSGGRMPPAEAISNFLQGTGQGSLQLVEARTAKPEVITARSAPGVALELTQLLSLLPSRFPKRDGLAIFVAGPVLLAFLVGRALNASLSGRLLLTNFKDQAYEFTYGLPFERKSIDIDLSPEAELRRVHTKEKVSRAIEQLRSEIAEADIPDDSLLPQGGRSALAAQLKALRVASDDSGEFKLSFTRGELHLGRGLLEAISKLDDPKIADLAKLFVLHELVHDVQGLRSTNFAGVGRASVALEQVDYLADAFALRALLRLEARQGGPRANQDEAIRDCGVRLIEVILAGIEAFDSLEHGARIERLTERRMRRYLIWHLQRSRAATVTNLADLDKMLLERVTVELAPVMGRIDIRRHEKVITQPTPATTLFAAVDGKLIRLAASRDFDPHAVVESLRSYGRTPLEQLMNYLVEENRSVLAPWRP